MPTTAYVALGGNLGDRHALLERAVESLRRTPGVRVLRVSSFLETAPVAAPPGSPPFLNAAAVVETDLSAADLLAALHHIEDELGRTRSAVNAPRTIDLDLLLYADYVIDTPKLVVPHPRLHERRFALGPLAEIAPDAVHPVSGQTVRELLRRLPPEPAARGLVGRRVLVTGATSGIGRAVTLRLARAGADVIVHGRDARRSRETAEEVTALGVRSAALLADLREPDAALRLAEQAWEVWGGLDAVVANAGADVLTGEAAAWPFERKLAELFAVDVVSTVNLCRALGGPMVDHGGGSIVTVGWDQADTGMEGDSGQLFGATKGAVMAFTRALALTLAPRVRVNCVAPGWIRTAWGETAPDHWQQRVLRETPLCRWGTPGDVADAVLWLVSPESVFVTGQTIRVNGGAVRS